MTKGVMTMLKLIDTDKAPGAVGPYSQGVLAGNFIYTSGQLPLNPESMELVIDIEAATRQSLENCQAILNEAGATFNNVVKVEIFLKDMNDFAKMNAVYGEFFNEHKPARACVQVAKLPMDAIVEIQMIAVC